jgi:ATP-binding cassette subfamily B multidrug efflux pump
MLNEFKRPLVYLARKWFPFSLGILTLLCVNILLLLIPRITKTILNDLVLLKTDNLLPLFLAIIGIAVAVGFFRYCWRMLIVRTSFYIEEQLRNELYEHYLKLDKTFYSQKKSGELIALATNDLQAVRMMFAMGVVGASDGIFLTVLSIFFMLSMDVSLTLFVLMPLPILTIFILLLGRQIYSRFAAVQESFSKLTARIQEYLKGPRLIKNFILQKYSTEDVAGFSSDLYVKNMSLVKIWGMLFPLMFFVTGLASALVVLLGGRLVIFREISIGEFVAFTSYIGILAWPMMAIGWVMNLFQRGKASLERIDSVLTTIPDIQNGSSKYQLNEEASFISLKDVNFTFPGSSKEVLKGINLTINRNEKIGITGRTGSGKTALVNIITRQYDPTEGKVYLYGNDYKLIDLETLRSKISLIPQYTVLFSESVKDNIAFSDEEIDFARIENAAQQAELESTINELNDRYETMLGERGVNLSGGQKQRVSLARALVRKSEMLIFDDSFSAVDTETEKKILHNISDRFQSVLIISHRVSTIAECDRILVIDEGTIAEEGTPNELIAKGGLYAELARRQKLEEEVAGGR